MKIKVEQVVPYGPAVVSAGCPHCGKEVTFNPVGPHDILIDGITLCGQRQCPDQSCKGHVFVVIRSGNIVAAYPPSRVPINKENIPVNVLKSFEEALDCMANGCYVASALMVRRTLEEICADKSAKGNNLKEKLNSLESIIVIPKELLEAMNELRLLGNDAAHIESNTFDKISEEELSVAVLFSKEIIKSIYQYVSLLEKLRALKKP